MDVIRRDGERMTTLFSLLAHHCILSLLIFVFFLVMPPPPTSTLFPYTTLFRSLRGGIVIVLDGIARPGHLRPLETRHGAEKLELHRDGKGSGQDRKSTRLNSSHTVISYAVFCLKKKKKIDNRNGCNKKRW